MVAVVVAVVISLAVTHEQLAVALAAAVEVVKQLTQVTAAAVQIILVVAVVAVAPDLQLVAQVVEVL
jgi:hypothetical protein